MFSIYWKYTRAENIFFKFYLVFIKFPPEIKIIYSIQTNPVFPYIILLLVYSSASIYNFIRIFNFIIYTSRLIADVTLKWRQASCQHLTMKQFSTQRLSVTCRVEVLFMLNVVFVFAWIQMFHHNVPFVQTLEGVVISLMDQRNHWNHRLLASSPQSSTLLTKVYTFSRVMK